MLLEYQKDRPTTPKQPECNDVVSLDRLSDNYREVVDAFLHGDSFSEIARNLHLSYECTRSRYRRAVKTLRRSML